MWTHNTNETKINLEVLEVNIRITVVIEQIQKKIFQNSESSSSSSFSKIDEAKFSSKKS
jgi:hypothetical protein